MLITLCLQGTCTNVEVVTMQMLSDLPGMGFELKCVNRSTFVMVTVHSKSIERFHLFRFFFLALSMGLILCCFS